MPDDIIAMDETAVWLDMPGENTVDIVGVKSAPLRTTGHEKNRITVCLAAKASGRKLQPHGCLQRWVLCKSYSRVF